MDDIKPIDCNRLLAELIEENEERQAQEEVDHVGEDRDEGENLGGKKHPLDEGPTPHDDPCRMAQRRGKPQPREETREQEDGIIGL